MRRATLISDWIGQEMSCLLAPVPVCHLPDALALAEGGHAVAFGTNAFEMMEELRNCGTLGQLEVYIVASKTGFDPKDPRHRAFEVGKVNFRGVLTGIQSADRRGKYPEDGFAQRPEPAKETDKQWAAFWEVSKLELLKPALPIGAFLKSDGSPWTKTPEGPSMATLA